jgi:hypothetical protein
MVHGSGMKLVFIVHSGACSLCDINPSKKREVQVVFEKVSIEKSIFLLSFISFYISFF